MDYTDNANVDELLEDLASLRKKESQKYMDCEDAIKQLQAENEQQADFLSLAKEELDSLRAENEQPKKRHTISPFEKELILQCIDFVKHSPKGFESIPLGHSLKEDIGLINQAEQALKGE